MRPGGDVVVDEVDDCLDRTPAGLDDSAWTPCLRLHDVGSAQFPRDLEVPRDTSTTQIRLWPSALSVATAVSPTPPAPITTIGSSAGSGSTLLTAL